MPTASAFIAWLRPSDDSLLARRGTPASARRPMQWWPPLMLVWSVWIFVTPMYEPQYFPHWLWPTIASYVVFLALYYSAYYRDRKQLPYAVAGVVLLGFALMPLNPGAQSYIIYACAFLAFCTTPKKAVAGMVALLAVFSAAWMLKGWPPIFLASGITVGLATGVMNITMDRKAQADAHLRLSHDEVRRLAAVAERERIGRDLHDLLGHTLSLVALKSELAGKLLASDPDAARREINDVAGVARDALAQVRRAVTGIRAAGLAAELLSARLMLEADGVHFHPRLGDATLPEDVETALALCVREAVTNIQRHAHATRVDVSLECRNHHALLRIEDDGRGGSFVHGNGLDGMRQRMECLGGTLRVEAAASRRGTVIEASLPCRLARPPLGHAA